ncbi:hypothetical protein [Roseivirga spongicola]|uniref:Lipoprotein n=1 Tax=Roseivirga spongicola TaxID=333140 RepID=A0A150XFG7_9BACT|nr:hypothetical protein [Roseivirga spongicola]KYG77455.1 hypothetical protein AWW68_01405 [Roseivirga spongicola]WPZ11160.1 hypothetical protein T7867_03480 [Roseivirga spongicola]
MKKLIALIVLAASFYSCSDLYDIKETVYLIKEGKHESSIENSANPKGLRTLKSETLNLTVRFDESVRYNLGNKNQQDINKLFGFADCNSLHHENSARFGWNYNPETDQVDIFTYVYQKKKRLYQQIGSMEIGTAVDMSISLEDHQYRFLFEDQSVVVERGAACDTGVYYLLYPYFGGDEVAPQDIRLYITEHLN